MRTRPGRGSPARRARRPGARRSRSPARACRTVREVELVAPSSPGLVLERPRRVDEVEEVEWEEEGSEVDRRLPLPDRVLALDDPPADQRRRVDHLVPGQRERDRRRVERLGGDVDRSRHALGRNGPPGREEGQARDLRHRVVDVRREPAESKRVDVRAVLVLGEVHVARPGDDMPDQLVPADALACDDGRHDVPVRELVTAALREDRDGIDLMRTRARPGSIA